MRGYFAAFAAVTASLLASASMAQDPALTAPLNESLIAIGNAGDRMTVPVSIAGQGPYGFIVDTGAERTVISRELAGHLNLKAGRDLRVTAVTGVSDQRSVIVPGLSISKISHETIEAPALGGMDLGAPGMLGVDSLQGHSITIDFDNKVMVVRPVAKRRAATSNDPEEVVVTAKSLYGQLIVTNAYYHGKRISVIIDTGSAITIGNQALLAAMKTPPRLLGAVSVTSATGQTLSVNQMLVNGLEIGGISFQDVPVAFSDAAPFTHFGLSGTPALLLGMDSLRMFRSVQIDFVSRQVRFMLPRGLKPALRVGI